MPSNADLAKARAQTRKCYQLLKSPEGQVIIDDLLKLFGGTTTPPDFNTTYSNSGAEGFIYRAGQRDVILHIQDMIERGET